jgi:hypothetical protein
VGNVVLPSSGEFRRSPVSYYQEIRVGARASFGRSRLAATEALLKMPKSSRMDLDSLR